MKKIVMCDDDPAIRNLFRKILEEMGYSVRVAGSGSETLEALAEEKPDLVLLDIMMEPMDGWEVLSHIRENKLTRDVPVIVFTGKMPLPDEIISYERMLNGFSMKPLRRKMFEDIVNAFFAEEAEIRGFCERALDSGADAEAVDEYAALRNNVRVLRDMFACLEKIMTANTKPYDEKDNDEFLKVHELLDMREERLLKLEKILNDNSPTSPGNNL
ncbi:response regulator [Methanoplanus endosymbiosus]|uniref:Response regulator n=1 Tax=Methanoplanus endosymbiosus TaxID=33865 RepID=A0A9E7TIH7_9EURY|nr:response regulator [Methanoplanus endosymbiosus]UUX92503.1 response regulator [Methanoplanus endosymbiosus]